MNRKDFVNYVCSDTKKKGFDTTVGETKWWAEFILDELTDVVIDNPKLSLRGLGTFEKRTNKPHLRSDFAGGIVEVKAHDRVKFTPSIGVKKAVHAGMNSSEYHRWMEITNQLRNGKEVPGWKLVGGYAEKDSV